MLASREDWLIRPTPKAILLDLDGTLINTMPTLTDIALSILQKYHYIEGPRAREEYLRTTGVPFAQQLELLFTSHPANADAAAEYEQLREIATGDAVLEPATRASLELLRATGVHLVISSNGFQDQVDKFAARSYDLFKMALGNSRGVGKGEPHFRAVCEALALTRRDLLFVGDSLYDGHVANQASVRFVACAGTFTREEFVSQFPSVLVIDRITQLPCLICENVSEL